MVEQNFEVNPNQNDRIMAALAHISIILPFMGVIAPIIIWVTQKEKSEYVAFQAIQAVVYQLTMLLAWFVGMGCYMLTFFSMFITTLFTSRSEGEVDPSAAPFFVGFFFLPFLIMGAMLLGQAFFFIYGLIGTVQTFRGKDFKYIVIGNYLQKNLQNGAK